MAPTKSPKIIKKKAHNKNRFLHNGSRRMSVLIPAKWFSLDYLPLSSFSKTLLAGSIAASSATLASDAAFDGETMVVTGSRIEQKLEDIAGSVSVVTEQQIEQFIMTDLSSLFRYEPGISTTGNGAQPQTVTVRGVGGNRLVYIKDGRRSNDGYAGGGGFIVGRGYFNTDTIRQVEVAKGAASSLYGSDGLGGIVVISTKDPQDYLQSADTFVSISAGYQGPSAEARYDLTTAIKVDNWAFSAAYTHSEGSEVQNYAGTLPGYDSNSDAILAKAMYQIDANQSLKFSLDHYQQEIDQVVLLDANETIDEDSNTAFSIDYFSDRLMPLWDLMELQFYVSQFEQKSDQIVASSRGYTDFNDYGFEQDIFGFRAVFAKDIIFGVGSDIVTHSLVYGIDHDAYDTSRPRLKTRILADGSTDFTDTPQRAFPGADTTLTGIFVQNNIDINDSAWSLILGGRLDFYDMDPKEDALYDSQGIVAIDETAFSPKLGAIYKLNNEVSFYGQYVQGFKIPPHDQAYQSHGVEPFYQILPNSDLESEESQTFELGMRINAGEWNMEVNGFYSKFENFIESTLIGLEGTVIPGVSKQLFQYQNLDETEIKGIELVFSQTINDALDWEFNAAWADGENKENGQSLTSISPLQGNFIFNADWQQWQFSTALRFARSMSDVPQDAVGADLIKSAGFGVIDLYARYEVDNWKFNIGVDNLLDKEYVRYESIAGLYATASTDQYTETGRELSANIRYEF